VLDADEFGRLFTHAGIDDGINQLACACSRLIHVSDTRKARIAREAAQRTTT
jgi:hypothetical protein